MKLITFAAAGEAEALTLLDAAKILLNAGDAEQARVMVGRAGLAVAEVLRRARADASER